MIFQKKATTKFHSKVLSQTLTRLVITENDVVPDFSKYYEFVVVHFTGISRYCLRLEGPDNEKIQSKMLFLSARNLLLLILGRIYEVLMLINKTRGDFSCDLLFKGLDRILNY